MTVLVASVGAVVDTVTEGTRVHTGTAGIGALELALRTSLAAENFVLVRANGIAHVKGFGYAKVFPSGTKERTVEGHTGFPVAADALGVHAQAILALLRTLGAVRHYGAEVDAVATVAFVRGIRTVGPAIADLGGTDAFIV